MGRTGRAVLVVAAVAAGAAVAGRAVDNRRARAWRDADARRRVVTVDRPVDEVLAAGLPEPVAALGDAVDVEVTAAPGGRGTRLAVRPRDGAAVDAGTVRRALREARALLEVGWVPSPDAPPTTGPTRTGTALRAVTRHGRDGGLR